MAAMSLLGGEAEAAYLLRESEAESVSAVNIESKLFYSAFNQKGD